MAQNGQLQTAGGDLIVCKAATHFKVLKDTSLSRTTDYRLRVVGAEELQIIIRKLTPMAVTLPGG